MQELPVERRGGRDAEQLAVLVRESTRNSNLKSKVDERL
jgi:hypothetical protein